MSTGIKIAIVAAIVCFAGITSLVAVGVSISNKEVRIRNQANMQQ